MRGWPARRPVPIAVLLLVATVCSPAGMAVAEMSLPPGFTARVYVSGGGFESGRSGTGVPSMSTLAMDDSGVLYLARTGRRYFSGEVDDLSTIYRVPPGGAALGPDSEPRFLYGPPLPNPQVAGVRDGREILVTTYDRDRRVGVLYRMNDGRAELFAGGTPERGQVALLTQPEAVACDRQGHVYVADRERGVVLKLDPQGRVVNPRVLQVSRPRLLAMDEAGTLWVGADGTASAPWQQGEGQLWKVNPDGAASLVLRGPIATGMALSPRGQLFLADRHGARIHRVTEDGQLAEFARFSDGDAPRALLFAPVTPETRRAGFAGDLFVVTIRRGAWPLNEVVRVTGPFDALDAATRPR